MVRAFAITGVLCAALLVGAWLITADGGPKPVGRPAQLRAEELVQRLERSAELVRQR